MRDGEVEQGAWKVARISAPYDLDLDVLISAVVICIEFV